MARLTQICVLFLAIMWSHHALSSPLFESINIERKVNIELKPMKFGPIKWVKEKLGPFGKFIKTHTIERRDLDEINAIDSKLAEIKPVRADRFIPVIERGEPIVHLPPFLQPPVKTVAVESPPPVIKLNTDISDAIPQAVIVDSVLAPASKLNTEISESIPVKSPAVEPIPIGPAPVSPYFTPVKTPEIKHLEELGAVAIVGAPPIEGPLLVPAPPKVVEPVVPASPPAEAPPGSRFGAFARFFGEIMSEIVNRIIARARLSFGQPQPAAAQ